MTQKPITTFQQSVMPEATQKLRNKEITEAEYLTLGFADIIAFEVNIPHSLALPIAEKCFSFFQKYARETL